MLIKLSLINFNDNLRKKFKNITKSICQADMANDQPP